MENWWKYFSLFIINQADTDLHVACVISKTPHPLLLPVFPPPSFLSSLLFSFLFIYIRYLIEQMLY